MSNSEPNKQTVRRFLKAIEQGDVAVIEALQAPACSWWIVGRGEVSRATYTSEVKSMLLAADPRKVEIVTLVAEGDFVAAEIRSEFHFGGRVYANEYHDLFEVRDGQIVRGKEYFDNVKVAAFFGAEAGAAQ